MDCFRQRFDEVFKREWPVQAHPDHADFLALGVQVFGCLCRGDAAAAQDHDHPFGVLGPDVVEQVVMPSGDLGKLVHNVLDDLWAGVVIGVDRFTGLEEHVRVLRRAANEGVLRRECPGAMGLDQAVVDHRPQVFIVELFDFVDLTGNPEALEEM